MKKIRVDAILFFLFSCFVILTTLPACQRSLPLQLTPAKASETNVVHLEIPEEQYTKLKGNSRRKFSLGNPWMSYNGREFKVDEIHLRGSSSMLYRRKSFSVDLKEPLSFSSGKKMNHFYLVSMSMDRSYYENVFAFHCLEQLNISGLHHQYTELWINNEPEGVYLLVQRPNDYALKDQDSPYVLRRGAHDRIDGEKWEKSTSEADAINYKSAFNRIASMSKEYQGESLYHAWQKMFDVDAYLRLLAFNYWVRNGDYADELYFYVSSSTPTPRFQILPWDFDDIFAAQPHEGAIEKKEMIGNQMLFSAEAELDRIIALDPFLYKVYLHHVRQVMEEISNEDLEKIMQGIYTSLHPYYSKPEVIEMSRYDQSRQTDLQRLKDDLSNSYELMVKRKEETLQKIQKKNLAPIAPEPVSKSH